MRNRSSTTIRPRGSVSTPASSSPRPPVFGSRPAAKRTTSAATVDPSASVATRWSSTPSTRSVPTPSLVATPIRSSSDCMAAPISPSIAVRILSTRSETVTSTPSAAKAVANSIPTGPAPTTSKRSGTRCIRSTSSESQTPGSSKRMPAGWWGREPVAITTAGASSRLGPPSASTSTQPSPVSLAGPLDPTRPRTR